jgi:hypothetical protein
VLRAILTPAQIEVAVWWAWDGKSLVEIAALCGCSQPAVSERLGRIQARLDKAGLPKLVQMRHPEPELDARVTYDLTAVEGFYH